MARSIKFYSLWISLLCVIVFILQQFIPGFTESLYLSSMAFARPWQFITAMFLHASLMHLFYNLFALFLFGIILEKLIGSEKFLGLFIFGGIFANFISFFWYPNALGASGAIMTIIGTLAILKPMMAVWGFGMILPMFFLAVIWVVGSIMGIFGFGDQNAGHLAHLSGVFIGILYGMYLRLTKKNEKEKSTFFQSKLVLPESYMRMWEDQHLRR
jgi:uncharacterized protein